MSTEAVNKTSINVNVTDVLWHTKRSAVETEMKEMLDLTDIDLADKRCFGARTSASSRVLEKMSERERALIYAEVESRKTQGNPENIQRE